MKLSWLHPALTCLEPSPASATHVALGWHLWALALCFLALQMPLPSSLLVLRLPGTPTPKAFPSMIPSLSPTLHLYKLCPAVFSLDTIFGCTSRPPGGTGLWTPGSAGTQWLLSNPGHRQQRHQECRLPRAMAGLRHPALPLTSCVTLGKLVNLSGLQFSHLSKNSTFFIVSKVMHVKLKAWHTTMLANNNSNNNNNNSNKKYLFG